MTKALTHTSIASKEHPRRRAQPKSNAPGSATRWLRSMAVFAILFFCMVLLRKAGFATGYWVVGLAAVGLLLLPTARLLAQRILFNGLIALGLVQLLWWIPENLLGTDHGTMILASIFGFIGAWVFHGRRPGTRIRRLIPVVRWVDSLPLLAGLLSALSMSTFLSIRSADAALSIMVTRWDFQSHFSIYNMMRTHGSVIPMIPGPVDGGAWGFIEYPQGFHSILATIAEIVSPSPRGLDAELVSFFNLQAVLCSLTVVLVTAGLCALPSVRSRALLLSPGIAVAVAAWVMGPGAIPIFEGFANFYVGCGIAVATILAMLASGKKIPVVVIAAMGAGLIGVSNNWILLVSLIFVVILLTLVSIIRDRQLYDLRWWLAVVPIIAVTLLGVVLAISQVLPLLGSAESILAAQGGMVLPEFGWALAIITVTVTLGVANLARLGGRRLWDIRRRRVGIVSVGFLLPVVICIWLAYTQVQSTGSISYYFYKYLVAVELVAWVVAVAGISTLAAQHDRSTRTNTPLALGATLALSSLAATQVFGFSIAGLKEIGLPPTAFPILESSIQAEHVRIVSPTVERLLASGHLGENRNALYVSSGSDIDLQLAFRWQLGMSGNLTSKNINLESKLLGIGLDKPASANIIADILSADTSLYIVLNPELYSKVSGNLSPGLEDRLLNVG